MDELLKKVEELGAKLEKAVAAGESVAELKAEIKKLQEEAVAMKVEMGDLKKAAPGKGNLPGVELEKNKFSLLRAINAIATKNWKHAGFEREVFENTSKDATMNKTMSTETDQAGGFIVPAQALGDFLELLRANLIVKALGAQVIDGLYGSPVEFPGQAGGATVAWLGEDNPDGLSASDLSLNGRSMNPHMCGALVKMSNRLLRMSNPSVENLVRQDLSFAMAEAIDKAAIMGTGAVAEPLGIKNVPGVLTYDMTSITKKVEIWNALYELECKLAEANSLRGKLGFAFHPRVKKYLSQARVGSGQAAEDGYGSFVADPIAQHHLASYLGYPYQSSTNLPIVTSTTPDESDVLFGNWAECLIGMWQGMTIMASQEADQAFVKNQTWVRIVQEADILVRHPESFCIGQHLSMELTA